MFWKKRQSREQEVAEQLNVEATKIVEILKGKWVQFQGTSKNTLI